MMETPATIPFTGAESAPALYIRWLSEHSQTHRGQPEDPDAPFLSVLMRTQGKRKETLMEALLSLEAQSDSDFEVILVIHRPTESDKEETKRLLGQLSPFMRARVRHFVLETGTRSAPLNLALSHARGRYIAMLDDDDVVFENWIEAFHEAAREKDGMAIRCYGMTQFWTVHENKKGPKVLQSSAAPQPAYCQPFDLGKHFSDNYTPISCVALPRACYSVFGIEFDETLTTAEDWDFLMRSMLLCGVHDTKKITFLYRLWQNTETSHTLHRESEWLRNRKYIMDKLDTIPYVTTNAERRALESGEAKEDAVLKLTFGQKLQRIYRTYGPWRFPFIVLRKALHRLFG
ncbi:MAG: glycosyltransferase family 2 protein [Clostridia bacterium]|nr:glycosyltransferase family 2 protein [Clostridia bacterium]